MSYPPNVLSCDSASTLPQIHLLLYRILYVALEAVQFAVRPIRGCC